ncbi:putative TRAP dicarboxylate transporter, DctP subunit [Vibrio nigripulchritudo SOn1]|uniref:TRAP dicarboxylate transporter, DctP subunit n=1 Tax=Vibrio nigripulchritudo SOn1 TaxID=1238450 RepID=A0AAV2VPZ5_9VIBR|nr:TRAP transporter substrate-binding protein [Vibrio nigripulchritudo]CCO46764.1 putative TRAP dicarboxylate transporter, DctP subunit [Vibrio nigripulchritudo SOn1]
MIKVRHWMLAILALVTSGSSLHAKELRLGLITPPPHIWTQSANAFAKELAEASNGELSVKVFPSRQLGNEAQMLQLLQTGALDMAFLTLAEVSNRVPDFGAFYAPYLVENVEEAGNLLRSDVARSVLKQLPRKVGVVGIGYGMGGLRQIVSRNAIQSAADLKGKKIRITPFEPIKDFYRALGSAPTPMPLSEVYQALANGQVDAIDMDAELIVKLKYYEHADSILLSNHMMFPMIGLISGKVWGGLNQDDRKKIKSLMDKHLGSTIDIYIEKEASWLKDIESLEINVVNVDRGYFEQEILEWEKTWNEITPFLKVLRDYKK